MFKKIKYVLIAVLTIGMLFSAECFAEDMTLKWSESKTVILSKVTYNSNTKKLTVHINEKAKKLAHEYELYLLSEDELIEPIGNFIYNDKNLYILAIMTVDVSDTSRIIDEGNGDFIIQDQDMYFGNNNPNIVGKKIYVGVDRKSVV